MNAQHVTRLQIQNFLGILAVEIDPKDARRVVISGKNNAGKTSVLDGIAIAVGGPKFARKLTKPIHEGAKKGNVTVETEDYIISRTWKTGDTSGSLTVKGKSGPIADTPAAFLEKLVGDLTFDPLAFANQKAAEQRETLLRLPVVEESMGVNLDEVAVRRKSLFDDRTDINRDVKRLAGSLESMEIPDAKTPKEEIDVQEIADRHTAAALDQSSLQSAEQAQTRAISECEAQEREVERITEALRVATEDRDHRRAVIKTAEKALEKQRAEVPELEAIGQELADANETNAAVRAASDYRETQKDLKAKTKESDGLTARIEILDQKKQEAVERATFPIEGLSVTDEGVTFNGHPFEQCALSEQLRAGVAIAMATNPKFRVIRITDASLLEPENMDLIGELAEANDFQIWLEIVASEEGCGFYIEEGVLAGEPE